MPITFRTEQYPTQFKNKKCGKDNHIFIYSTLFYICYHKIYFICIYASSVVNKFEELKLRVQVNIDILILTETNLDNTFPTQQFDIAGYISPGRQDRNRHGGGILIYIKEDIPSKEFACIPRCYI